MDSEARSPDPAAPRTAYVAVVAVCALTTLLATPLADSIAPTNIALVYLLAVVVCATRWGRGPGVLASVLAVACFDFFFVPPRFTFTVDQAQYLITFAAMLAVSLTIAHLTHAQRVQALRAEARAAEASLLQELATALATAVDAGGVRVQLDAVLGRRLGATASIFAADADGNLATPAGTPPPAPGERLAAAAVWRSGRTSAPSPDLRDDAMTILVPLRAGARQAGVLALHFAPAAHPPDPALAEAIAALVATAGERVESLAAAQAAALDARSERLRNSILAAISHDLRTPLTLLYGIADTLARRPELSPDSRELAEVLRQQSRRLHRMVDNLLDLARLRSGRVVLRRDWQSLPEMLGASLREMSGWIDPSRVVVELPPDLPLLELDAVLLDRVLCNLLDNAAKYSPPETPIRISAATEGLPPRRLALHIDNAGAGFPPERIGQVFESFERGQPESGVAGVGIGLAVCRAIVDAHGGSIAATNRPGGARVTVLLPLPEVPPRVDDDAEAGDD